MVVRSIRSGAGKACSVALAVTLSTMGITPAAFANDAGGGESGDAIAQVSRSYLPKTVDADSCDAVIDGIGYSFGEYDEEATILGVVNPSEVPSNLVIPSTILANAGEWNESQNQVTTLAADAELGAATSCILPSTLSTIQTSDDSYAFAGGACEYYFLGGYPTVGEDLGWGEEGPSLQSLFATAPTSGNVYVATDSIEEWVLATLGGLTAKGFDKPESISITSTEATISDSGVVNVALGGKVKLDAKSVFADPDSEAAKLCPAALSQITWTSEDTDRATVDAEGNVTLLDRAELGDTFAVKASNAAGSESRITVKVVEAAEQPPAPTKIDLNDCVFEQPNKYSPVPDQALPIAADPEVRVFKDFSVSNPLVKGVDFELSYKDSNGTAIATVSDISEPGAYKLVVTGIGEYTGTCEFDFNVISSSLVFGDWEYALDGDNAIIVSYKGTAGNDKDVSIPAEVNGHQATSIAAGALTGEFAVLRVPASVTSLATGAMDGLNCGHVMFEGNIPAGTNAVTSSSSVGIYFADTADADGWNAEGTWAFAFIPHAYDASWTMSPATDETGRFVWTVSGHTWAANDGDDKSKLEVPSRFASANVVKMNENAIADASSIDELRIPDSIRTIADGAVKGLSDSAVVRFGGRPPAGASYGAGANPEFQGSSGAKSAGQFTYLPANKAAWTNGEPGTNWIAGYAFSEEDIFKCVATDFVYLDLGEGRYSVVGYLGSDEAVRIPGELTGEKVRVYKEATYDENGLPVASYEERELTGSVVEIADKAFNYKTESPIVQLKVPASVEKIGESAFLQSDLESISFEEGSKLKSIGETAFARTNLVSIDIPEGVEWIGEDAFVAATMASINVSAGNATYTSDDGILFSKDKKTLVFYPQNRAAKSYTLPAGVEALANCAFMAQYDDLVTNLETLNLDNGSLKTIGSRAFANLRWVKEVTIPDTVEKMGSAVFSSADSLTTVHLPENGKLESIPDSMFQFCGLLTTVNIPAGVKTLENDSFLECDSLSVVTLPEGLETIAEGAFDGCGQLITVNFPQSLKRIGAGAFQVTRIDTVDLSATSVEIIDDGAFALSYTKHVKMPGRSLQKMGESVFSSCDMIETVEFPAESSLVEIPAGTFYGNTSLREIVIPDYIESIGSHAFFGCSGLKAASGEDGDNGGRVIFLSRGSWNMAADAFNENGGNSEGGTILEEVPMTDIPVYGYTVSSTQENLPNHKFIPLDVELTDEWNANTVVPVGVPTDIVGRAVDREGQTYEYRWSLDDVKQEEGAQPHVLFTFTPAEEGVYKVSLEVTNSLDPAHPTVFTTFVTASNNPIPDPGPDPEPGPGSEIVDIATGSLINPIDPQPYKGVPVTPSVTVTVGAKTLVEGVDYTLSYQNNNKIGQATVVVSGKGAYKGVAYIPFDIVSSVRTTFVDVPQGAWFYESVTKAAERGLMTGYESQPGKDAYFGPEDSLTRGQSALIFARIAGAGLDSAAANKTPFIDVADGQYYTDAINWAYENKIMRGVGPDYTKVNPNAFITREELIVMTYNFAKMSGADMSASNTAFLQKVDWRMVDSWVCDAMVWATDKGVLNGYDLGDGTFAIGPVDTSTRAQMAAFAVALVENVL